MPGKSGTECLNSLFTFKSMFIKGGRTGGNGGKLNGETG